MSYPFCGICGVPIGHFLCECNREKEELDDMEVAHAEQEEQSCPAN